ncbi:acyl-homoserine-lactone synthase [Paracoccaceae bacterium]|nr:acyl-homoserine-lactone synthase [Paracoccaceae bacterium]
MDLDENGFERDEYDALNPIYVILENNLGRHEGSLRLLPTTGRCMINEKFCFLLGGSSLSSPLIRESTRFCLAPKAFKHSASKLMLAAGEVMLGFGVEQSVAVFDHTMRRIYRRIGATPEILAEQGSGKTYIGPEMEFSPLATPGGCPQREGFSGTFKPLV